MMGAAWGQDAASLAASAHGGAAEARHLAQTYEAGVNGCRDPIKALQFYQLALAQGDRSAAPDVMRLMSAASAPPSYVVPTAVQAHAAQALAMARRWRADAQLSGVNITPKQAGFVLQLEFLSLRDRQGLWIWFERCAAAAPTQREAGTVSWPRTPLPTQFLDFDRAISIATANGLHGQIDHARLTVADRGQLIWQISPAAGRDVIVDAHSGRTYPIGQVYTADLGLPHLQAPASVQTGTAGRGAAPSNINSRAMAQYIGQLHQTYMHNCPPSQKWNGHDCS